MSAMPAWLIWAALSAVFAAMTAIFAKLGLQAIDADMATLIRTVIIFALMLLMVWLKGVWTPLNTINPRTWLFLGLSGLATGASWLCYFRALRAGPASQVAPIDKFSLVLVVIFATLFLGERPVAREWLGIALVAAGVMVLALRR